MANGSAPRENTEADWHCVNFITVSPVPTGLAKVSTLPKVEGKAMQINDCGVCAAVTYRANLASGQGVEMSLVLPPARATLLDAWSRLNAAYDEVDPTSLEVEIRRAGARQATSRTSVLDLARAVLKVSRRPELVC